MPPQSFLDDRESARFVGRGRELALIDGLLAGTAPPLLFVHGAGGNGKSALLREAARRARSLGIVVARIEGRDPDRAADDLAAATEPGRAEGDTLLIVDTYEAAPALGARLRDTLDELLKHRTRILIAGRRPPEAAWRDSGWSELLRSTALSPLGPAESDDVLLRRGIEDAGARARVADWAAGSPLALAVAADAILAGHDLDLAHLDADDLLATTLLEHLIDDELGGANREVLAIASLARTVDARLLAAALPGVDGDHAELWLRGCSFSEQLGTGLTVHDHVRRAVRTTLRATDPGRAAELRRRAADHLYRRGLAGESRLLVDMAELIDDPAMRWMLSPPPSALRTDRLRPGDREDVAARLVSSDAPLWPTLERWFVEHPDAVVVVRDERNAVLGFMLVVPTGATPPWISDDPVLGRWLAEAERYARTGGVLFLRGSRALRPVGDEAFQSSVIGTGNHYVAMQSELGSVRYVFAAADADDERLTAGLVAIGYERAPALDAVDQGRPLAGFIHDYGPGGVIGWGRDLVYASVGLPAPSTLTPLAVDEEAVRDALRAFHDASALATSPLARGTTLEERAASVRERLEQAARAAFGASDDERLQAEVLRLGYLAPDGGHVQAMQRLHLSRTTYFRRLAAAASRVTEHVLS